jgi:hypothetical protein
MAAVKHEPIQKSQRSVSPEAVRAEARQTELGSDYTKASGSPVTAASGSSRGGRDAPSEPWRETLSGSFREEHELESRMP